MADEFPRCAANHAPLSPVGFLRRAASAYGGRTSIIYGASKRFTWRQTSERCCRLAAALRRLLKINKNDVVSVLAPNVPALYELHFAVPMAGAVLNAINTRLDAATVATILNHSEAKALFIDCHCVPLAMDALRSLMKDQNPPSPLPLVVVIDDPEAPTGLRLGELEYEALIAGTSDYDESVIRWEPEDEWDTISLNYTSGTTSSPKGVVYSHRGVYLSALSLLLQWGVRSFPVYLWSLPMFHCNGWTLTWGMAACGGTNVCARGVDPKGLLKAVADHGVTHMCGAPVVFNMILDAAAEQGCRRLSQGNAVNVLVGGAPPPAALLQRVEQMGFRVSHAYGMTEATGPALVCEWQPEWNALSASAQSSLKARQGVPVLSLSSADVVHSATLSSVPRDGRTVGEIMLRGSSVMKGYYNNSADTAAAFRGNGTWFATGDVGVVHPDGYVEVRDRLKDIIISGGENVSSVEVEAALCRHPEVDEAAVVAMPHPWWGEVPCAFVVRRVDSSKQVIEQELLEHCRKMMAGFMVPKKIVFVKGLPRTGTGKVVKAELRERAKAFACEFGDRSGGRRDKVQEQPPPAVSRL